MKLPTNIPKAIIQQVATVAIRCYAAHSFIYYEKDDQIIPDGEFDEVCKWLLDNYDSVKPFDISGYLDRSALEAGTGFNISKKVCGQTRDYALSLLETNKNIKKTKPQEELIDIDDMF